MTGLIRLADRPEHRWRNGGGVTRELAVGSHGPVSDFAWRISVATIAADGQFSRFDGVDRSLMQLGGGRLRIDLGGDAMIAEPRRPIRFAGEGIVAADIAGEPASVLNVMTRRPLAVHHIEAIDAHTRLCSGSIGIKRFLVAVDHVAVGGIDMAAGDLLTLPAAGPTPDIKGACGRLALITIYHSKAG